MRAAAIATGAGLALAGCGTFSAHNPISPSRARIDLSSSAFAAGAPIPPRFTCQGQDVSPPLEWSGVPGGTRRLDLVMRDPDAPGGNFVHWQLTGLRPSTRALGAGETPPGAAIGRNGFGTIGYRGPCPPPGPAHHYVITLTARAGAAVLGTGTLTGTYARR